MRLYNGQPFQKHLTEDYLDCTLCTKGKMPTDGHIGLTMADIGMKKSHPRYGMTLALTFHKHVQAHHKDCVITSTAVAKPKAEKAPESSPSVMKPSITHVAEKQFETADTALMERVTAVAKRYGMGITAASHKVARDDAGISALDSPFQENRIQPTEDITRKYNLLNKALTDYRLARARLWDAQDDYHKTVDAAQRKQKAPKDTMLNLSNSADLSKVKKAVAEGQTDNRKPDVTPARKSAQGNKSGGKESKPEASKAPGTQEKKAVSTVHGMARKRTNDDYIRGGDIIDIDSMPMPQIEQLSQKDLDKTRDKRYSSGKMTKAEMNAA